VLSREIEPKHLLSDTESVEFDFTAHLASRLKVPWQAVDEALGAWLFVAKAARGDAPRIAPAQGQTHAA
jgi:hypothetical protein